MIDELIDAILAVPITEWGSYGEVFIHSKQPLQIFKDGRYIRCNDFLYMLHETQKAKLADYIAKVVSYTDDQRQQNVAKVIAALKKTQISPKLKQACEDALERSTNRRRFADNDFIEASNHGRAAFAREILEGYYD